jgi:hypothetical protein
MGGVVERGVSGDACHGKIEEVFSRSIATTKLSGKLIRTLDGWYMNLNQVDTITYHDGCSTALYIVNR